MGGGRVYIIHNTRIGEEGAVDVSDTRNSVMQAVQQIKKKMQLLKDA